MSKITQFDMYKIVLLNQQGDFQRASIQKPGTSQHGVQHVLKNVRKPDK